MKLRCKNCDWDIHWNGCWRHSGIMTRYCTLNLNGDVAEPDDGILFVWDVVEL
jgi:hypothetical protein